MKGLLLGIIALFLVAGASVISVDSAHATADPILCGDVNGWSGTSYTEEPDGTVNSYDYGYLADYVDGSGGYEINAYTQVAGDVDEDGDVDGDDVDDLLLFTLFGSPYIPANDCSADPNEITCGDVDRGDESGIPDGNIDQDDLDYLFYEILGYHDNAYTRFAGDVNGNDRLDFDDYNTLYDYINSSDPMETYCGPNEVKITILGETTFDGNTANRPLGDMRVIDADPNHNVVVGTLDPTGSIEIEIPYIYGLEFALSSDYHILLDSSGTLDPDDPYTIPWDTEDDTIFTVYESNQYEKANLDVYWHTFYAYGIASQWSHWPDWIETEILASQTNRDYTLGDCSRAFYLPAGIPTYFEETPDPNGCPNSADTATILHEFGHLVHDGMDSDWGFDNTPPPSVMEGWAMYFPAEILDDDGYYEDTSGTTVDLDSDSYKWQADGDYSDVGDPLYEEDYNAGMVWATVAWDIRQDFEHWDGWMLDIVMYILRYKQPDDLDEMLEWMAFYSGGMIDDAGFCTMIESHNVEGFWDGWPDECP